MPIFLKKFFLLLFFPIFSIFSPIYLPLPFSRVPRHDPDPDPDLYPTYPLTVWKGGGGPMLVNGPPPIIRMGYGKEGNKTRIGTRTRNKGEHEKGVGEDGEKGGRYWKLLKENVGRNIEAGIYE